MFQWLSPFQGRPYSSKLKRAEISSLQPYSSTLFALHHCNCFRSPVRTTAYLLIITLLCTFLIPTGTPTTGGLRSGRPMIWTAIPGQGMICFSLLRRVETTSEAYPASHPMGTGGYFPRGKATQAWNYSPPTTVEVKSAWSYTSIPYVVMASFLMANRHSIGCYLTLYDELIHTWNTWN